jgi:hypothetical protein
MLNRAPASVIPFRGMAFPHFFGGEIGSKKTPAKARDF